VVIVLFMTLFVIIVAAQVAVTSSRIRRAAEQDLGPSNSPCAWRIKSAAIVPPERFRPILERALVGSGVKILTPRQDGRVVATKGFTLLSYGSIVTVWYGASPMGTDYLLEVRPRQPFVLLDYGRNKRLVDLIVAHLPQPGPVPPPGPLRAQWAPDPSGRHQHRWWDGARWTDQVSDGGQQSVDPVPANS
jgi:hypothetical protein